MTLVSFSHDFIYLRTRKTGSTATEFALTPYCVPNGVEVDQDNIWPVRTADGIVSRRARAEGGWDGLRSTLFWNGVTKQVNRRYWVAHQSAWRVRFNLGRSAFERLTKVTTLRNPFARMVSLFFWVNRNRPSRTADVERAVEGFRNFVKRGTYGNDREIVFIGDRFVPDVVLRQETLDADLRAFLSDRGADMSRYALTREKTTKSSDASARPAFKDLFDEETADIVREKFNWMFQFGRYPLEVPA